METADKAEAKIKINRMFLQRIVIVGILLALVIVLSFVSDKFFTLKNIYNVTRQVAMIIITGSAVTLLMISGHFDLSVGSNLALTGVLYAIFASVKIALPIALFLAILAGGLAGLINGVLVVKLRIPSIITTLGMLYVARGLAFISCGGVSVATGLPKSFSALGRGFVGVLPIPLIVMLAVIAVFYIIESRTILGRYCYAIGSNRNTAVLSGINVNGVVLAMYVLVGLMAGLSGTIMSSRIGVGQPNVGQGFEFDVIVAVLLGGTSLSGGEGSVSGMVVGAFIVGFLANGLNLLGIHTFYQDVLKGLVLVGAVLLDRTLKERLT